MEVMMDAAFKDLKENKNRMVMDRQRYENALKEISRYVLPHRSNWEWDDDSEVLRPAIYDSTAVKANQDLADGYQGNMINPSSPWLNIGFRDPAVEKDTKYKDWAKEHAEPGLYRIFSRSNFYAAIGQTLQDNALGTAVLYIEKDEETIINYVPQHLKGIYIAEDSHDRIDTVFHKMKIPNRVILENYGDNVPDKEKAQMEKAPYARSIVWRAVLPNKDYTKDGVGKDGMYWSSITFLDGDPDKPLKRGGYKRMPYVVWRPVKCTGEAYGRSPAWFALGDILRINQLEKAMLELALLSVKPPLNVPSDILDEVNVTPWGMNPYEDPNKVISPIVLGQNFPYGVEERGQLRESIRNFFMSDTFRLMSNFADKEYSATQAAEMAGEKGAMATAMTSRTGTELLDPIIEVTLMWGIEAKEIPAPPNGGIPGGLKVDYVGPITMDQQRAYRTSGTLRGLNQVIPFMEMKPEIWDLIKDTEMFRDLLDASGMPAKHMNNRREVEEIRQQRAEQMQKQQDAELQKMNAQAYKDTTWPAEPGSAAEAARDGARQ